MKETTFEDSLKRWGRPERIVFAVSIDSKGKPNIISLGWKMRTSLEPPMVAISVGVDRYSHDLIKESGEFVIAVPGEDLAEATYFCGTQTGEKTDKFKESGLTALPSKYIKTPIIKECIVNLECKLVGQLLSGDHTIFVGEVLNSWASEDDRSNLLMIGNESGYKVISEDFIFRFGIVKK